MTPADRHIRMAGVLIVAAGLTAAGVAIFAEALGLGAEEARGMFGWKRIALLAAGALGLVAGASLWARPGIASRLIDWEELGPIGRRIRGAGALLAALGPIAAGVAIFAEELGLGAEAARGVFGWKRISLLAAGGVALGVGATLFARPRPLSRWLTEEETSAFRRRLADRYPRDIAIGLLGLLGLALVWTRLMHITESLWYDEAHSALYATGLTDAFGGHVLFNQLSWATISVLGESEATHRFWSVVPAIAAIGFASWWAWRRVGVVAAVAFAALAVAAPLHLDLAPQARGYGLTLLAATLMLISADWLSRTQSKRAAAAFLGAGLAGIWTLIFFAASFVGQVASLLRWPRLRIPAAAILAAAGALSLLYHGTGRYGQVAGEVIPLGGALLLERTLDWLVVPIATMMTVEDRLVLIDEPLAPGWASIAALALIAVALMALILRKDAGLALILLVPPLFFNLAFSLGDLNTVARHQLPLLPHVLMLVAIGVAEVGGALARVRVLRPVLVAVGAFAVLALSKAIVEEEQGSLPRQDFKQAASVVERSGIEPAVTDTFFRDGLRYYLGSDLEFVSPEAVESMLCEDGRELAYIRYLPFPDRGAADLDCLAGRDAVRVRIPQRIGGYAIDVWLVEPSASEDPTAEEREVLTVPE